MAQSKPHSGKLSVVTGASTGIGLELAKCCARDGMALLVVADEAEIEQAAETLRGLGAASVEALQADLSDEKGVDRLTDAIAGRPIEHLIANAGRGLGKGFLDQDWEEARFVVDTNITGTIYLLHEVVPEMVAAGEGRVLITGSIAGFMPGSFQAVYNGTKAFLDSFSFALREEIKDSGVTVTCLMPGATETEFFDRADLMDTKIGTEKKMDPAEVAEQGYKAMLDGKGEVITGWQNKTQAAMALMTPAGRLAKTHAKETAPGTARH
jgi:short-subunit dehydrogenase